MRYGVCWWFWWGNRKDLTSQTLMQNSTETGFFPCHISSPRIEDLPLLCVCLFPEQTLISPNHVSGVTPPPCFLQLRLAANQRSSSSSSLLKRLGDHKSQMFPSLGQAHVLFVNVIGSLGLKAWVCEVLWSQLLCYMCSLFPVILSLSGNRRHFHNPPPLIRNPKIQKALKQGVFLNFAANLNRGYVEYLLTDVFDYRCCCRPHWGCYEIEALSTFFAFGNPEYSELQSNPRVSGKGLGTCTPFCL